MEFAKSLRVEDRVHGFKTKVFLKRYARRYLPNNIVNRRKRGLSVPISSWLRGSLNEWATAALENARLKRVGIHTSAAMELLSEHCQRKADHARALWTLLVLGEWLDWVATDTDCRQTCQGDNGVSSPIRLVARFDRERLKDRKRLGNAQRRHLGIRARMCGEDPCPGLALGC